MAKRPGGPTPWREWFFSLLLGVGMAILCIALLSRCQSPAVQTTTSSTSRQSGQSSIGLEFNFAMRILLPEHKGG